MIKKISLRCVSRNGLSCGAMSVILDTWRKKTREKKQQKM